MDLPCTLAVPLGPRTVVVDVVGTATVRDLLIVH